MRYNKVFAGLTLAAGMFLGSGSAVAGEWREGRDLGHDYATVDRLRSDIARDRFRLDEAVRFGRHYEAERVAGDLARDERALAAQKRDIRRDEHREYRDRY